MPQTILIASPELRRAARDVEAILGGTVVAAADRADIVAFAGTRPQVDVQGLAQRTGARPVGFAPPPLRIAALDEAGRPLGYLLTGFTPEGRLPEGSSVPGDRFAALRAAAETVPALATIPAAGDPRARLEKCVWLDPYDRTPIALSDAVDLAEEMLRFLGRDPVPPIGLNITVGKRRHIEPFVTFPLHRLKQFSRLAPAVAEAKRTGGRIMVWASWRHDRSERRCAAEGVRLARVEDGFLRSVGLGAAFVRSMSLVVDGRGIYYDPSRESDLEHLLQYGEFDARLVARAGALREGIVAANLTKYNVGPARGASRVSPDGATAVLVPGQVEDDASILRGAAAVKTNLGLIQAARNRWPDAFLIYKPHPDVEAGYRVGRVPDAEALRYCDRVVRDRSITALFDECRAVETMTSLAGFEGLLRGLLVATHGQPFYSGWGLTDDLAPCARRTRPRSLEELVAATLILYPRYVDPHSGLPCGPELILRRLAATRERATGRRQRVERIVQHGLALARHRIVGRMLKRLT